MLRLIEVLQAHEGMDEPEDPDADPERVARTFRCADRPIRSHPRRIRLVLPDERRGKRLVRAREQSTCLRPVRRRHRSRRPLQSRHQHPQRIAQFGKVAAMGQRPHAVDFRTQFRECVCGRAPYGCEQNVQSRVARDHEPGLIQVVERGRFRARQPGCLWSLRLQHLQRHPEAVRQQPEHIETVHRLNAALDL
ncbi:hypothetical protein [Streptomyces sp. NPDC006274]|uniref:hypothetical protein n=1 Tax=Streptomyces sp. NPDC006274 TaxID=3154582 RepID=UPI0033B3F40B